MNIVRLSMRILILLLGVAGVYLELYGSSQHIDVFKLAFYTIQSNLLVCILYAFLLIRFQGNVVSLPVLRLKTALTLAISVTGLGWHILLARVMAAYVSEPLPALASALLHGWVPALVFADWLCFDRKPSISLRAPLIWLLIPGLYFIFVCLRAYLGDPLFSDVRYPYFFIDFDRYPAVIIWRNVMLLAAAFALLGYSYAGLDRLVAKLRSLY